MKLDISLVPYGLLAQSLSGVWKWLEVAAKLTDGRCCVDDLVRLVLNGQYNLWVVFDTETQMLNGFFMTEVKQYPQRKMLCVQHCAMEPGNMQAIEPRMQELATRFAKDNGCHGVEFVGRPGWKRYSKANGYASHSAVYQQFFEEAKP